MKRPVSMTSSAARKPDIHKGNVRAYFSRNVRYWETAYATSGTADAAVDRNLMHSRKEAVLASVERHAKGRNLKILDAGCGPGVILEELARRGHEVAGIDLSEEMVREANARLMPLQAGRLPCRLGDVERLPFKEGSMDVVLCLGVLPYLHDDHTALSEIRRVLKQGGMGILVLPNLLRLGILFDPYYYLRRSWQYAWHQLAGPRKTRQRQETVEFGANRSFAIRRYGFWHIDSLFHYTCLRRTAVEGTDYGPLTVWGKPVLPAHACIRMSDRLVVLSRKRGLGWLHCLANQWVISFIKTKGGIRCL